MQPRGVFGWLGAIEDVFYALVAFALLLFGIGLVVRAAHRVGGVVLASSVVVAAAVAAGVVVRDVRRRRWTPVSVAVGITFGVCFAAVVVLEFVAAMS